MSTKQNRQMTLVDFTSDGSPENFKTFIGKNRANLHLLHNALYSLILTVSGLKIVADQATYEGLAKKYPGFDGTVRTVLADLVAKVRADKKYVVTEAEIEQAVATAKTKFEESALSPALTFLTFAPLSSTQLMNLVGEDEAHLKKMSAAIGSLPLYIKSGRVVTDYKAFSALTTADRMRLQFAFSTLEGQALNNFNITSGLVANVIDRMNRVQNIGMKSIAMRTTSGMQIDIKEACPSDLEGHRLINPIIRNETSEDPEFKPRRILSFKDAGMDILRLISNHGGVHLNRFADATECAISVEKNCVTLIGDQGKTKEACLKLALFTKELDKQGVRSAEGVAAVLSYALGEMKADALAQKLATPANDLSKDHNRGKSALLAASPISFSDAKCVKTLAQLTINRWLPKSPNQAFFIDCLEDDNRHYVVVQGPAGTGKTGLCLQAAMDKLVRSYRGEEKNPISKLIITKPHETRAIEKFGALRGDANEKMAPTMKSYFDHLYTMVSPVRKNGTIDFQAGHDFIDQLIEAEIIEIVPIPFLRGNSYANACVVLDEGQNAGVKGINTFLTRIGENSKCIVMGDLGQSDIADIYEGERWTRVSQNLSVDDKGLVHLTVHDGRELVLEKHENVAFFRKAEDGSGLVLAKAKNGFSNLLLTQCETPDFSFVAMREYDIQRRDAIRRMLLAERAFSVPCQSEGSGDPIGKKGLFYFSKEKLLEMEQQEMENLRTKTQSDVGTLRDNVVRIHSAIVAPGQG